MQAISEAQVTAGLFPSAWHEGVSLGIHYCLAYSLQYPTSLLIGTNVCYASICCTDLALTSHKKGTFNGNNIRDTGDSRTISFRMA